MRPLRICSIVLLLLAAFALRAERAYADVKHKEEQTEQDIKRKKRELQKKYKPTCPTGTEKMGDLPPDARQMWCEVPTAKGRLSHGNYYKWRKDGGLEGDGEYYMGRKHGAWTEYYPNGTKKTVTVWNDGKRLKEERFDKKGKEVKKPDAKDAAKKKEERKVNNRRPAVAR